MIGSLGVHDVGLQSDEALISLKDHPYTDWEKMTHGLLVELVGRKLMTVDELRRGVEALEPELYNALSYYERWAASMVAVLIERKVISRAEVEAWLDASAPGATPVPTPTTFAVGDKVEVRPEGAIRRWRKPHLRIPGYLHGAVGTVVQVVGRFEDPAYSAFREYNERILSRAGDRQRSEKSEAWKDSGYQHLYVVRFTYPEVERGLPQGARSHAAQGDAVTADIFHPWLIPATRPELQESARVTTHQEHDHHGHSHSHGHGHSHGSHGHENHKHDSRREAECKAVSIEAESKPLEPLAIALYSILDSKGIVPLQAVRERVAILDGLKNRALGARLVARAWVDPSFKARLLADAPAAAKELKIATSNYTAGVSLDPNQRKEDVEHPLGTTILRVVENTPEVHHLVVCTLCSCYPASVLGLSPEWYKSKSYRSQAVLRPRQMLEQSFGLKLLPNQKIEVHDSTAEIRYMVLPMRPSWTESLTEEELVGYVTRDSMIGVGVIPPTPPARSRM